MIRALTFIPVVRPGTEYPDLHYVEQSSRNRGVGALFEDVAPGRSPARDRFLQKAYGEVVSRYGSVGRIEHPLPFLRSLTQALDSLSRRVECRVDDFTGIGVFVLLRDADSFYLLSSRAGCVLIDTGDGFVPVDAPGRAWIRELPLETASAQKELFTHSVRDYLALYRIDTPAPAVPGVGAPTFLRLVMGGRRSDVDAVVEGVGRPGALGGVDGATDTLGLDGVSRKVVYLEFGPARPVRDPVLDALRAGEPRRGPRTRLLATAATTTVVFAAVASLWIGSRLGGAAPDDVATTDGPEKSVQTTATQRASVRHEDMAPADVEQRVELRAEPEAIVAPEASTADAPAPGQVRMAVSWRREYSQAVTTTPVVDGDAVIFGARDGRVYALDRQNGETAWSYDASAGVGASPVVAGNVVIGADYQGEVFCLEKSGGTRVWKRALPARVVSTPCVAGGEVMVGCTDGVAYGLSLETGRILWRVKTGGRIRGSAAAADGSFYVTSYDGKVYAVSQGSGALRWTHTIGGQLSSTPAADGDRVVAGADGGIFAIDAKSGRRLWRYRTRAPVRSFIVMEGGRVYAGGNDGSVYCLDAADGEELWKAVTGDAVLSRPRLEGGLLFVTSYDKNVYCFNAATGERMDAFGTAGPIFSSPVIHGNQLFFGNNEGEFYCINYRSRDLR